MKNAFAFLSILIFCTFAQAESMQGLPNLMEAKNQIYTAGQPGEEGFSQMMKMGIKTVINVLPEGERLSGEPQTAAHYKITYLALPLDIENFNRRTVERFAEMLYAHPERPILIHCSTGNHVGALWFAYLVLMENVPLGIALKEGRRIGMQPWLENMIFDWVAMERENLKFEMQERAS